MDIIGNRRYVEIAGEKTHELPPLLVCDALHPKRMDKMVGLAAEMVDEESLLPPGAPLDDLEEHDLQRRRFELALQLSDQYLGLLAHWRWGNGILEWIRQCETTFELRTELRPLLRPDIWPHAGRASFITLLQDKQIDTGGIDMPKAVGLRLAFRQLPPIRCCSDQFLFYLKDSVAASAFTTWSHMAPAEASSLPPERFQFQVVHM